MAIQTLLSKLVPTLHEDNILLAVNKPAGVDVGRIPNRPITFNLVDTLAEASTGPGEGLFVTNRLARHESGVLLLAKDRGLADHIRTGLKTGHVTQVYTILLKGKMKGKHLLIQTGPSPPTTGKGRRDRGKVRSARADGATEVVRLEVGETRTLVSCTTVAENTHVLRAQLRSAGLHLVGDSRSAAGDAAKPPTTPHLHLSKVSFHHPARKSRLTVHCPLPGAFAASVGGHRPSNAPRGAEPSARSGDKTAPSTLLEQRLLTALLTRLECLLDEQTDSRRLLTGDAEGVPGLVVEKHGDIVIIQQRSPSPRKKPTPLRKIAQWYQRMLGTRAVYVKPFVKDTDGGRGGLTGPASSPEPLLGEPVAPEIVTSEQGLHFAIRPYEGLSVGLFLDQRENRRRVRERAKGLDVLNLFAYTCGFSVAAAAGGAASTTSVDISTKSLEWGKRNFGLNGIDLSGHWFIRSSASDYFKRAKRQERSFDLIVIDAPSFAHGRKGKGSFSFKADMPDLLVGALSVLNTDGIVMLSTNNRGIHARHLRQCVAQAAGSRHHKVIAAPRLPADFAVDPDHAKTIFVKFD